MFQGRKLFFFERGRLGWKEERTYLLEREMRTVPNQQTALSIEAVAMSFEIHSLLASLPLPSFPPPKSILVARPDFDMAALVNWNKAMIPQDY